MAVWQKLGNSLRLSTKVATLGMNSISKLKLFFIVLLLHIQKVASLNVRHKVRLQKFGKTFDVYLSNISDLAILKEIFLDDEYDFDLNKKPKIIFDLGSNIGLSVIYFRLKYPNAEIYAFEPDPKSVAKIRANIKPFTNIRIFDWAISDKNGTEKFYLYPKNSISSSLIKRSPNQISIDVTCKTLDSIMLDLGVNRIDLLKFDIEGGEAKALSNFRNKNKVSNYVGELHLDLTKKNLKFFNMLFAQFETTFKEISPNKRYVLRAMKND